MNSDKIEILGEFSEKDIENKLGYVNSDPRLKFKKIPKTQIPDHPGFEIISTEDGQLYKLAYNKLYSTEEYDLDIELENIKKYEPLLKHGNKKVRDAATDKIKFHYRRAVSLIDPKFAKGWNRWSEEILHLFLENKLYKVLWGSGNCGKSATYGMLLYIKWRVNPAGRMIVITTKVVKDASARVFGYIKEIHAKAPPSGYYEFATTYSAQDKSIYCKVYDEKDNKWVNGDRSCITSLPVKVDAKKNEVGSNLMGKHPDDILILAFDEGQELSSKLLGERIFYNWLTNTNIEVHAWGNPMPIEFHAPETWDLLFKLGAGFISLEKIRRLEKEAEKTTKWGDRDTSVLHLSMMDSPKDDPDEIDAIIIKSNGQEIQRLHFLAGKHNVSQIARGGSANPNSPAWYSQVLGFPWVSTKGTLHQGILSPVMIQEVNKYPLIWRDERRLKWFMGVDSATSGFNDTASIVVGKMGQMADSRMGADFMNGEHCRKITPVEGEEFSDTVIKAMWSIGRQLKIPLHHVSVEVHGAGDVLRYALERHLKEGTIWPEDYKEGRRFHIVNPTVKPSERYMFMTLGTLQEAKEMVTCCNTEYNVAVRCGVLNRQIFNIPEYICGQAYNRFLFKNSSGTKFQIEKKDDMKKRGVKSPNDLDALVYCVELMRHRGFSFKFQKSGWVNKFGVEYNAKRERKLINKRMGIVSRLLGTELINQIDISSKKKKKKIRFKNTQFPII